MLIDLAGLQQNHSRAAQIPAPVEVQRNFRCAHYWECLEQALERDWAGFSCLACPRYKRAGQGSSYGEGYGLQACDPEEDTALLFESENDFLGYQ